jgi:hypothetical protein
VRFSSTGVSIDLFRKELRWSKEFLVVNVGLNRIRLKPGIAAEAAVPI